MRAYLKTSLAAIAFVAFAAAPVAAQKSGGVKIGGSVQQTTTVNSNINSAIGKGATAKTRIGAVGGGTKIGGSLKQTTTVNSNINSAIGKGAKACTSIGTIGDDGKC